MKQHKRSATLAGIVTRTTAAGPEVPVPGGYDDVRENIARPTTALTPAGREMPESL